VVPALVRNRAPAASEIGVERRLVAFLLVPVAARGVGLPELEQRAGHPPAQLVENAPVDDDARADCALARPGEIVDEVVVEFAKNVVAEHRPGYFRPGVLERNQRLLRRAQHRGLVAGREGFRMPLAVAREKTPRLWLAVGDK